MSSKAIPAKIKPLVYSVRGKEYTCICIFKRGESHEWQEAGLRGVTMEGYPKDCGRTETLMLASCHSPSDLKNCAHELVTLEWISIDTTKRL
jgi:hypothetical protein